GELVGLSAEVGAVRVASDHPQGELLAASADPDRWTGLLQRLGIALRTPEREELPVVVDVGLGPQRRHDLDGLAEHADAIAGGGQPAVGRHVAAGPVVVTAGPELVAVAVGPVLVLVPAGTDPPVEPASAHHV